MTVLCSEVIVTVLCSAVIVTVLCSAVIVTVLCSEVIVAAFYSDHSTFYTTKKHFQKIVKNCIFIKLFLKLIRLYKQKGKYTMCIGPVKLRK